MKLHEIIGLTIILLVSTIYSFTLPQETVEQIENNPQIKITVTGKCQETLHFDEAPTIEMVFQQLKIENNYGFDEHTILQNQTVFYIPNGDNLISLNHASSEELMTIKGIGAKTAQKIIEYRQKQPFLTIEEIQNVPGIGVKTYERIRSLLCL